MDERTLSFVRTIINRPTKWVITLSQQTWGVVKTYFESEIPSGEKYWKATCCYYEDTKDDIPLLRGYHIDFGYFGDNGEMLVVKRDEYEVTQLIPGPPDLSEFDVYQFLQPGVKIGEITTASFTPARIAAIVIGVILVVIGLYLRLRRVNKS
jgi:hypothetical protein